MRIKKGDKVKILLGKDSGKTGTVERVFSKTGQVLITGLNIYKRHLKPKRQGDQSSGGIVDISRPINVSKIALICPKCDKQTRIGIQFNDKIKSRICCKCKALI